MAAVTELVEGASILFPEGPRVVVAVGPLSARLRDISGEVWDVSWAEIGEARGIHGAYVDAVAPSMSAMWEGLPAEAKDEALDRLEVVLTILTGYSRGHAALARPGEPFTDFDPARPGDPPCALESAPWDGSWPVKPWQTGDESGPRSRESGPWALGWDR